MIANSGPWLNVSTLKYSGSWLPVTLHSSKTQFFISSSAVFKASEIVAGPLKCWIS